MNCKQVRDNLSPYLDQVLSQEEVNLVEKHLEKCSSCRQELIDLKKPGV
jgi:predicted anti-sigma-YlaC factor YlaD